MGDELTEFWIETVISTIHMKNLKVILVLLAGHPFLSVQIMKLAALVLLINPDQIGLLHRAIQSSLGTSLLKLGNEDYHSDQLVGFLPNLFL